MSRISWERSDPECEMLDCNMMKAISAGCSHGSSFMEPSIGNSAIVHSVKTLPDVQNMFTHKCCRVLSELNFIRGKLSAPIPEKQKILERWENTLYHVITWIKPNLLMYHVQQEGQKNKTRVFHHNLHFPFITSHESEVLNQVFEDSSIDAKT